MLKLRHYIFLFFLFTTTLFCRASKIETFNFGYGATQYTSIFQDEKGLVWLGSNRGLFFYDGYQAHPFQLGSYVYSINQVNPDQLCFTDENGVHILQLSTERILITSLSEVDLGQVRSCYSKDGILWLGSEKKGLIVYNSANDTWDIIHKEIGDCYSLEYAGDKIYTGSDKGFGYYDLSKQEFISIPLPDTKTLGFVNSLLWDEKRNCLWIGTIGSLFQYLPDNDQFNIIDVKPTSFKCMTFDVDHRLLVGTDDGLVTYNPEQKSATYREHDVRYEHSLSSNIIWSIYQDRAHNIWMGTDQGVSLMHYTPYYSYIPILYLTANSSLPNNEGNRFTCITRDSHDGYWYGGTNGVIYRSKEGELKWFRKGNAQGPLPHNRIRRVYEDKEKMIWMATDEGLLRFDNQRKQFIPYIITDASGKYDAKWVYDVFEDRKGRMWIATYSGNLFVTDKKKLIESKDETYICQQIADIATGTEHIPSHVFYILEDKKGNLWIGHKHGLSYIDIETMRMEEVPLLNEKGEYSQVYIGNLTIGEDGNLWYTVKNALFKMNMATREISRLSVPTIEDDIVSTMIYRDGRLWMSMVNKTILFDTRTLSCKELRLPENDYQALYYDQSKAEFIFGGNDGLLYVQPEIGTVSNTSNRVQVVSVMSNNKRLKPNIDYMKRADDTKTYDSFSPSVLQLTFEISDFSFSEMNTLSYQYQLEGYDNKWISMPPGNNRIVFLNLNPGKYVLNIRNGVENAATSAYYFEIRPPWYMTGWAYASYITIFLVALGLFIRYLFGKNKKKYERLEKEKSLELSNMKIDFFTNISHELKTPLSLIIAPLSKVVAEVGSSSVGQQLELVHQNALRLNTLIQQILDFKRMEYKEEETMVRSRIDLVRLVHMVASSFNHIADTRHLDIKVETDEEALWMNLDLFKMESILYNLLSNAIKFVPNDTGRITVRMYKPEAEDKIRIIVEDNGTGIAEDELKLIWLRLYQGGNKQLNPHGTGIGLYLVKRFVTMHSGTIGIESEFGKGTSFTIDIPLNGENIVAETANAEIAKNETVIDAPADKRTTILIIDDNEEILSFLTSAFSTTYKCIAAKNGKDGLDMALKMHPDIVIVDEMMPVMTGMEFCHQLRKATHMASVPVIMLTAKDDSSTELNSMKAGVDVFMSKPFDLNRLTLRIQQLLESRKQLQEKMHLNQMIDTTVDIKEELFNEDERLMKHVLQVIEDNMSDSAFNVTQLCTETGIGSKRLLRMLKKQTGMTPVNFIRQIRLKKAAILLQQKKFTVSEVMYMIGFSHPSYFTKSFTEEFGLSPKEYLEQDYEQKI